MFMARPSSTVAPRGNWLYWLPAETAGAGLLAHARLTAAGLNHGTEAAFPGYALIVRVALEDHPWIEQRAARNAESDLSRL
jgi:hypothetical protein